jgi:hypothetical protein
MSLIEILTLIFIKSMNLNHKLKEYFDYYILSDKINGQN